MYAAIFKSRREEAKKFRKWVTSEVLPTIRKTGSYHAAGAVPPAPTFSTSNLSHGADLAVAADRTFRSFMRAARVAGLRGGRALQIANSQTLARTGIDMLAELGMDLASPLDQAGCRHLNDSGVGEFGAAWVDGRLPLPATICRSAELYSAYRHWRGMDFACPINRFTEYMEKAQRTVRKRHVSANFADKDIAVRCFVVGNPFALVQPGGMSRHAAREIDQFSAALAEWQGAVG
jgi:hypothetical protein